MTDIDPKVTIKAFFLDCDETAPAAPNAAVFGTIPNFNVGNVDAIVLPGAAGYTHENLIAANDDGVYYKLTQWLGDASGKHGIIPGKACEKFDWLKSDDGDATSTHHSHHQ